MPCAASAFALPARAQSAAASPCVDQPAAAARSVQPITIEWGRHRRSRRADRQLHVAGVADVDLRRRRRVGVHERVRRRRAFPRARDGKISGLPNGTYFWRVMAHADRRRRVFSLDSPWSPVRSFTVVGLGPAPGRPSFTSPANGAQFHVREFFLIDWTDVPDAHHYLLEADDEPTFSYPLTLTTGRACSSGRPSAPDGAMRSTSTTASWPCRRTACAACPSPTLNVQHHERRAGSAAAHTAVPDRRRDGHVAVHARLERHGEPAGRRLRHRHRQRAQLPGHRRRAAGPGRHPLRLPGRCRTRLVEGTNIFPPGTYFWRVRAVHGDVLGPWSAGQSFTVVASPPTPPGLAIFHIIAEPGSVSGGNSTQARVTLNMPAPPGGALISIATDMPQAPDADQRADPAGKTDAIVSPITTVTGAGRHDRHRQRRLRPRLAAKLARPVADPLGPRAQQRERGRRHLRRGDGDAAESGAAGRRRRWRW